MRCRPKLTDPQGKQSLSKGVAGGASKRTGRGREDDGAGGDKELIFNGIILENVGQVFVS